MVDLVTFGETMLRLSPRHQERIETADEYDVHVAGSESNVAVAAQRLGLDSAWISKLPDSAPAKKIISEVQRHGVTTDVIWDETDEGRVGTYYLEKGETPRGNEVIYDRARASVTTARTDEVPMGRIENATGFHTSGITPALSATLEDTTADLLAMANDSGTTTSLDVNYRSKLWEPAEAKAVLTDMFPDVDVLLVAKRDAETVLNVHGDPLEIATKLNEEYGFATTVVTHGAKGAMAAANGEEYVQRAFEATNAHPVGSGDSFVGGFLSQYLAGESIAASLEWGSATAALKRSIPGDIAVVSPDEIERIIQGDTIDIDR